MMPRLLAMGVVALCLSVKGAERIPLEHFTRSPEFREMRLSADGLYLAAVREVKGLDLLFVASSVTLQWKGFDTGSASAIRGDREIDWFQWLGSDRLLVRTKANNFWEGLAVISRDGSDWKPLSGHVDYGSGIRLNYEPLLAYFVIHTFENERDLLALDMRDTQTESAVYPHVVKIDSVDGIAKRVVKNPGGVIEWYADREGIVRAGIRKVGAKNELLHRSDETAPWSTISGLDDDAFVVGFSADGTGIYMSMAGEDSCSGLYRYDIASGTKGEPLFSLQGYDVLYADSYGATKAVWSKAKKDYLALKYTTERPGIKWLDPEVEDKMAYFDKRVPDAFNEPVSITNDGKEMLIFSSTDRYPGAYYVFDLSTRRIRPVARVMPWIDPQQMAAMKPITYKSRDGLDIHGYLTVPLGAEAANLPLVVMPHGGPWVRDTWGYDPLVQMLANRGYAVLQMNYRGSPGYGGGFSKKGRREVGGAIQQDIEDGTRWAIQSGIADPKRIAIVGGSYGGYSALYAVGKNPDLYRCGISIAGVTDWVAIYSGVSDPEYKLAREHWIREIGHPDSDKEKLQLISPVNFASDMKAPLLLIQGKEDKTVPPKQARKMIAALEKAGRKPQSLFIAGAGHTFNSEKARLEVFKAVEAFLAKHLGKGAD